MSKIESTLEKPRIGVFICHCGLNIAGTLDIKELVEYSKKTKLGESPLPAVQQIQDLINQTKIGRCRVDETGRKYHVAYDKICSDEQFLYKTIGAMQVVAPANRDEWNVFGKRVRDAAKYLS